MRKEGIIKYFNMYTGEILSDDKEYIFRKEFDEDLQEGDLVTFEPYNYESPDIKQDVALLVKKKDYKNERSR